MNPLVSLNKMGQSIWLDFFDREIMNSGKLQKLIDNDKLAGITSNPSIFEKAILGGSDYDEDIKALATEESDFESLFFKFAVQDIRRAAGFLKPVFDATSGNDGFVSIEVSPFLANDEEETVKQAIELWQEVNCQNVMIKIPATKEGIGAIRRVTAKGINVNVTLLFGLEQYKEVLDAYLSGLEERVNAGKPINQIRSVASFFLSRIDVLLDPSLIKQNLKSLTGEIAIASAKIAYQIYLDFFKSERFKKLITAGATPQRLLWASTGTKNPEYSDVKYVEPLIGHNTVNTLPLNTINAFRDHGRAKLTIQEDFTKAAENLKLLKKNGFDMNAISNQLEAEGIEKFNKSFRSLLKAIDEKATSA